MGEGDRPRHGVGPEEAPAAYRYVGLYDSAAPPPSSEPEQTAPLGIGSWSAGTEEVTAPSSEPADAWYSWPPTESSPARASARRPAPARAMPGRSQPTRRTGLGVVVLVAALTALLVGAAAGYV